MWMSQTNKKKSTITYFTLLCSHWSNVLTSLMYVLEPKPWFFSKCCLNLTKLQTSQCYLSLLPWWWRSTDYCYWPLLQVSVKNRHLTVYDSFMHHPWAHTDETPQGLSSSKHIDQRKRLSGSVWSGKPHSWLCLNGGLFQNKNQSKEVGRIM